MEAIEVIGDATLIAVEVRVGVRVGVGVGPVGVNKDNDNLWLRQPRAWKKDCLMEWSQYLQT